MSASTAIAWCDATFNPWWGCVKVSPACTNCYAEAFSHRLGKKLWGVDADRRFFGEKHWREPLAWNEKAKRTGRRLRVFSGSMCDIAEDRPDLAIARAQLCGLIVDTPNLDWLLLTKRPENYLRLFAFFGDEWPKNVWAGTTVENQEYADLRIPALLKVPASVRWLSMEPLLGKVLLDNGCTGWLTCTSKEVDGEAAVDECCESFSMNGDHFRGIDWVVVGGESGSDEARREMSLDAARGIFDQVRAAGCSFFMKQDSSKRPGAKGRIPADLWVREFPMENPA